LLFCDAYENWVKDGDLLGVTYENWWCYGFYGWKIVS
jgi:hypothetical protein